MIGNIMTKFSVLEPAISNYFRICNCILTRNFQTSQVILAHDDRKTWHRTMPPKDEGLGNVELEKGLGVDLHKIEKVKFPDENTPDLIINGVRFADIPICYIRVTKNNTIFTVTDSKGISIEYRSCGIEGYKNAKKGTNVAAQATAINIGLLAREKGVKQVRVVIKGLGPGRAASMKGLQMSGMNIVSITDNTRVSSLRPRKARRL